MPYPSLPSARRVHYEIDGCVSGYNTSSFGSGLTTVFSSANRVALNGETPTVDSGVVSGRGSWFFYVIFPELVDLSYFVTRWINGGATAVFGSIASSTDTTNGGDGTWNTMSTSGTALVGGTGDWWRSATPASLTSNNTGIKAIRFSVSSSGGIGGDATNLHNFYIWGSKHSGETPDDILFLESDGSTEWPNDDDWGNVNAGGSGVAHTYYVKNSSATKTANSITVKSSGSDNGRWTVSKDNVTFSSSVSITSLAAGATQVIYVKFTPPTLTSSVLRPHAAYIEADVTSWT